MVRSQLIIILIACSIGLYGQSVLERAALNNIKKQKWDQCKQKLEKLNRKDSVSAGGKYVLALYFFSTENPDYNIDSAYAGIQSCIADYQITPSKEREKLEKLPLDSLIIVRLKASIDSAAFVRATELDTEEGYVFFISKFSGAAQIPQAVELRDEAAYNIALRENTYEVFAQFLTKYPKSRQASEAEAKYHELLYYKKTSDKLLTSYQAFLKNYPASPYRNTAEQRLLEIMTADGDPGGLRQFLHMYPESHAAKKARDILFYLNNLNLLEDSLLMCSDSLRAMVQLNEGYLVPFIEDDNFGFINDEGQVIINPKSSEIDDIYLCGNINEELLVLEDMIVSRNNTALYKGAIDELEELQSGFIAITEEDCLRVLHKSGFQVGPSCMDDAYILLNRFVVMKKGSRWSIYSLSGLMLFDAAWDDVKACGGLIGLKKGDQWILSTPESLGKVANQSSLPSRMYHQIREWSSNITWVEHNGKEGLLRSDLSFVIPLEENSLQPIYCGAIRKFSEGKKIFNLITNKSSYFLDILVNGNSISVKVLNGWRLIEDQQFSFTSSVFDTIKYIGSFPVGYTPDSTVVIFSPEKSMDVRNKELKFIPGKDSTFYLQVNDGEKKIIYDNQGEKLFDCRCDNIQYIGNEIFTYEVKNKKGLVRRDGRVISKPVYDAIGEVDNFRIPLLSKMKFGYYDLRTNNELKPTYDKNLVFLNEQWIMAFQEGKYGLLNSHHKPVTNFEFDEIKPWNDTTVLVRINKEWAIRDVNNKLNVLDKISRINFIRDNENDKLIIIRQENTFGVLSSKDGIIIPITFTDIVNVGSTQKPLYFTEKHVPEASIYVVIYYNDKGEVIRKQAFDADNYDKIYCSK